MVFFYLRLIIYAFSHPSQIKLIIKNTRTDREICLKNRIPWFTYGAIEWLEKNLDKNIVAFEWGSGGSTLFFTSRIHKITSIEHNIEWYKKISRMIREEEITNCEYYFIEQELSDKDEQIICKKIGDGGTEFYKYYKFISSYPDNYFDMIIIDGRARNLCIKEAMSKIKPGGIIILDNSDRVEYAKGINIMSDWGRKDFYGPGPSSYYFGKTSIFTKPNRI